MTRVVGENLQVPNPNIAKNNFLRITAVTIISAICANTAFIAIPSRMDPRPKAAHDQVEAAEFLQKSDRQQRE